MGYFPNGTSGMMYQQEWCDRCVHDAPDEDRFCPIWNLHLLHNYEFDNKIVREFLDTLIPRTEDRLDNEMCRCFHDDGDPDKKPRVMTPADHAYLAWKKEQGL